MIEQDKETLDKIKEATGAEHLEFVGLDDTFGFKCQQCGQCCMNRNDIILNPFDVYNASKYLGITCEDFIKDYAHIELGGQSKIPMVLLKTTENGFCPFLKFDIKDGGKFKCAIHAVKPGACANHPIGVVRSSNPKTGIEELGFIKVDQCPNSVSDEQQLVMDWVKNYLDHEDEISYAHKLQTMAVEYFDTRDFWLTIQELLHRMHESAESDEHHEVIARVLDLPKTYLATSIGLIYARYDINKPFIEQAQASMEELKTFYTQTKTLYDMLKHVLNDDTEEETE